MVINNKILPLVSIITPVFNSERYLQEMIESVLSQTYTNWELLIVDDYSKDSSLLLCQEFARKDSRIHIFPQNKNLGAAVARNLAIKNAKGRFIAFLDSDDLWEINKLQEQVHFMLENDYSFTYSSYSIIDEDSEVIGKYTPPTKTTYHELLKNCVIGCLTAMYDSHKLGKVEMPLIRKRQDYALWLKILKKTTYAHALDKQLSKYRKRNDSLSSNKIQAAKYNWYLYRKIEKLSILKSLYYFLHYAISGVLKHTIKN